MENAVIKDHDKDKTDLRPSSLACGMPNSCASVDGCRTRRLENVSTIRD